MSRVIRRLILLNLSAWLLCGGTLAAQSKDELRKRYGEPVSETFLVSPGICVTATFGTNGRVYEFLIAPEDTGLVKSRNRTLSRDSVDAIIEGLVPPSARGKSLFGGIVNATCLPENDCNGTSKSYEKATMFYSTAPEGRVHYAVVQLKE